MKKKVLHFFDFYCWRILCWVLVGFVVWGNMISFGGVTLVYGMYIFEYMHNVTFYCFVCIWAVTFDIVLGRSQPCDEVSCFYCLEPSGFHWKSQGGMQVSDDHFTLSRL